MIDVSLEFVYNKPGRKLWFLRCRRVLSVSGGNTFDETTGYWYQGNVLREGFFYTEETLGEWGRYTGYNPDRRIRI